MEPKQRMNKRTLQLLEEIRAAEETVRSVQKDLEHVHHATLSGERLAKVKERLSELRVRLEVMLDFVLTCRNEANRKWPESEEVDIWI